MSENEIQDVELILELSRRNSLAVVPGKNNWIEKTDDEGLPDYIARIAKHIMNSGKSRSVAIASAISQVKKWAAGGEDVKPDTRAKAQAALAAWERLKAKNAARSKKVGLTNSKGKLEQVIDPYELVALSVSYSMDSIRRQFDEKIRKARAAKRSVTGTYESDPMDYLWVKEVWTNYLIVKGDHGEGARTYRVDYTVDKMGKASFATPVEVKTQYVTIKQLAESEGTIAELSADDVDEILMLSETRSAYKLAGKAQILADRLGK